MPFRGEIGDITETGRSESEFNLEWKIPDFLSLSCGDGDHYRSCSFNACSGRWCFKIYPNGVAGITSSRWVGVFLLRLDAGPSKVINITLGIRGTEGAENKKETLVELSEDDNVQVCCWIGFCLRSKLREHKSRLMPRNVLTLTLNMRSDVPNVVKDSSTQGVEESKEDKVPTEEHHSLEKQGGEKALEDFGKLLASGENSDVSVQVGDAEFKVHGAILFARSPALSVSLKHESKEKISRRIVIEDCEPDVFREYLQYLYTGSVKTLTEQNVFGLYRVADMYLADDLKRQCLKHIGETLSVQTFCDTVKLALTHGESGLLQLSTNFAAENMQSIVTSAEWQNFNCEYPRQVNEILIKCFGPRS